MEKKLKNKCIKFNMQNEDEKLIFDFFENGNNNFSKTTKKLLLEYIKNSKTENEKSIIDVLEKHTKLLEKLVRKGIIIDDDCSDPQEEGYKVEEKKEESDFNIDFLNQL